MKKLTLKYIILGRQAATTLPTFPTLPASSVTAAVTAAPTVANTVVTTNIVTPVGQTCICVPTGSCTGVSNPDGSGLIDIRIVTNVSVRERFFFALKLQSDLRTLFANACLLMC